MLVDEIAGTLNASLVTRKPNVLQQLNMQLGLLRYLPQGHSSNGGATRGRKTRKSIVGSEDDRSDLSNLATTMAELT